MIQYIDKDKIVEKQREHKPYGQRKECEDCQFNYAGECKGYCALKRNEHKPTEVVHPRWISVEDELPNFLDNVLYCDEDGDYYTETDNIGQDVKITHWMRIPDCPPLQNFCNNLRAVLNGENEEGGEG